MPYGEHDTDPLGYDKAPSLSFNNKPIGTTYVGRVLGPASLVQSRDYKTGEPATWKNSTDPKMAVVIRIEVDGEPYSLWAVKPSAMFAALVAAQKEAGQRIGEGGTLHIRLTGETPSTDPRLNAAKQYQCKYVPPVHDAFADEPAPAPTQQSRETARMPPYVSAATKQGW